MCSLVILFFFFKQKTAYEMRISDWSSDVCSSDLRPHIGGIVGQRHVGFVPDGADRRDTAPGTIATPRGRNHRQSMRRYQYADVRSLQEIGRASCRERVCQYV